MDTLLNFSGGLDSTYCLYHILKNNPDKTLLVHHCSIINHEGRHRVELNAVQRILGWMVSNGYKNFKFIHTTYDYGNLKYIVKDKEVIGFQTGVILRAPRNQSVNKVVISSSSEDISNTEYYKKSEKVRMDVISAVAQRPVEYVYPIEKMSRVQMMAMLPRSLWNLVWYCRTPLPNGKTCNRCKTCKQVARDLATLNQAQQFAGKNNDNKKSAQGVHAQGNTGQRRQILRQVGSGNGTLRN